MSPFQNLANRLIEIVYSNRMCLSNWGFYLFDKEFDDEPELRNKLGTIWLCSLFDTLEAQSRFLPEIEREANAGGWESLAENARQLAKFGTLTGEVLDLFSRNEQIFLQDYRNQLVHSYLAGRHREKIAVKVFKNGVFAAETIPRSEYHEICFSFTERSGSMDQALTPLIARVINRQVPLRYWNAADSMVKHGEEIYRIICAGETIAINV